MGALLGAEEFDFGKMVLIAEGCIMARVCEKNTCPAGIATHDPKFKQRYTGSPESVIKDLKYLAQDVKKHLALIGHKNLYDLVGKTGLLIENSKYKNVLKKYNLHLNHFLKNSLHVRYNQKNYVKEVNSLNVKILSDYKQNKLLKNYAIKSTDKAIPASLMGHIALEVNHARLKSNDLTLRPDLNKKIHLNFIGSAGQGFDIFTTQEFNIKLGGEANDSVAKGMSGGNVTIISHQKSKLDSNSNVLIGNTALYGATGGNFYLNGLSGDRFAVRNSGALAITKGVGLHACEYMTGGTVIILGDALENIGAGMTEGILYTNNENIQNINSDFLKRTPISHQDKEGLNIKLNDYFDKIGEPKSNTELDKIIFSLNKLFCKHLLF